MSAHERRLSDCPCRGSRADMPRDVPLPPAPLPLFRAGRMRKQWRYVGVWTPQLSVYAGVAKVGLVPQEFWAIWHPASNRFLERTRLFPGKVQLPPGRMTVRDGDVAVDLALEEDEGLEVTIPDGDRGAYIWVRRQFIRAHGTLRFDSQTHSIDATAFIDDNAGYHPRRINWLWSGGVGTDTEGRKVTWSVIIGYPHDRPPNSENTVWVNGVAREVEVAHFAPDLSTLSFAGGGTIHFQQEAIRARSDNLILIKSDYAQPIGKFTGTLPFGIQLREAYGVMERHGALW